jgi:hypothetical protein
VATLIGFSGGMLWMVAILLALALGLAGAVLLAARGAGVGPRMASPRIASHGRPATSRRAR